MLAKSTNKEPSITARWLDTFRSHSDVIFVRAVAIMTAVMGIINVFSSSLPALMERLSVLDQISPLEVTRGSRLATVVAGFALLLLSRNLWRRKQVAWFLTVVILLTSAVSHLLKGLDLNQLIPTRLIRHRW